MGVQNNKNNLTGGVGIGAHNVRTISSAGFGVCLSGSNLDSKISLLGSHLTFPRFIFFMFKWEGGDHNMRLKIFKN